MYPYCTINRNLSRSPNGTEDVTNEIDISKSIGYFYILLGCVMIPISCFVFFVISRQPLIKHTCYKVMTFTTALDIINMVSAMWICGIFSVLKIHHCSNGIWVMYYSQFVMFFWYLYCSSTEVLVLNRMLEFANKRLSRFLFDGQRIYLWVAVVLIYATACTALVPDAWYHYDPYGGTFYFIRSSGKVNVVHLFNNFFKFGFITLSYRVMLIFMFRLSRQTTLNPVLSSFQIKVSIQALMIAVLADGVTLGYLAAAYLPLSPEVAKYTGTFGQLLWISVHSGSALIYLFLNRTVNLHFRRFLSGSDHVVHITSSVAPTEMFQMFRKVIPSVTNG